MLVYLRSAPTVQFMCNDTMTAHQLTAKCTNIMTQWHKVQNAKRIEPNNNDDDQRVSNSTVSTRHVSDASNTHVILRYE